MKLMDLLYDFANCKEVPEKFKFEGKIFTKGPDGIYRDEYKNELSHVINYGLSNLNGEIEIIEEAEDKEYEDIEEIAYKPRKVQNAINALIRNQNKIIERMKRDE